LTLARASSALVWAIWLLILLLELATPPAVVLGILYVVPLLLGASQRTPTQAWRFLLICCTSTLLNLLVPLPLHHNIASVLIDRLLVCLGLVVTTALVVRNQELERQRIAIEVELGQANLRGDVIATLAHDIKTPVLGTLASLSLLEGSAAVEAIRSNQQRCCGMELLADPSLLQRLIENLLLNAVHHNLRGQRVWLQLSRQEGEWWIDVRDGGEGFPPEQLPRLFQRFAQSGNGTPGAGLGLYLCRLISEAHGGIITASNTPGGGARVLVQLPQREP
jgi:two-component system NarL family sensor kinase